MTERDDPSFWAAIPVGERVLLAVHGRPRATGDLDIWVDATPDNADW